MADYITLHGPVLGDPFWSAVLTEDKGHYTVSSPVFQADLRDRHLLSFSTAQTVVEACLVEEGYDFDPEDWLNVSHDPDDQNAWHLPVRVQR